MDFPIRILDNMIQVEEAMTGVSIYNRGEKLKNSLIDPTKVKAFICEHKSTTNKRSASVGLKSHLSRVNEKKQWKLMLNHFKNNPADLLDALPTPEGSEDGNALKGFESGLTPKKNFKMHFKDLTKRMGPLSARSR